MAAYQTRKKVDNHIATERLLSTTSMIKVAGLFATRGVQNRLDMYLTL